jgi:hypothetical protein
MRMSHFIKLEEGKNQYRREFENFADGPFQRPNYMEKAEPVNLFQSLLTRASRKAVEAATIRMRNAGELHESSFVGVIVETQLSRADMPTGNV